MSCIFIAKFLWKLNLLFTVPPRIQSKINRHEVVIDGEISMSCIIQARPIGEVTWFLDAQQITQKVPTVSIQTFNIQVCWQLLGSCFHRSNQNFRKNYPCSLLCVIDDWNEYNSSNDKILTPIAWLIFICAGLEFNKPSQSWPLKYT